MKFVVFAGLALLSSAVPAMTQTSSRIIAPEGKTIACYKAVTVAPRIRVKQIKVADSRLQYEHRNGRIELVDYPPVYKQIEEIIEPEHILLKAIPCT